MKIIYDGETFEASEGLVFFACAMGVALLLGAFFAGMALVVAAGGAI